MSDPIDADTPAAVRDADPGCSEAGNWFSGYGMGNCPVRGEPCPAGCLRKTAASMRLTIASHPANIDAAVALARADGIREAARLAKKLGNKSIERAILESIK